MGRGRLSVRRLLLWLHGFDTGFDDGFDTGFDDDDGFLDECGDAMQGCVTDEECYRCLASSSSGQSDDDVTGESDDDVSELCGEEPT